MMEEWGKTWQMEEDQQNMKLEMPDQKQVIQFEVDNEYLSKQDSDLLAQAKKLIEEQQIQEAILCLEALV